DQGKSRSVKNCACHCPAWLSNLGNFHVPRICSSGNSSQGRSRESNCQHGSSALTPTRKFGTGSDRIPTRNPCSRRFRSSSCLTTHHSRVITHHSPLTIHSLHCLSDGQRLRIGHRFQPS